MTGMLNQWPMQVTEELYLATRMGHLNLTTQLLEQNLHPLLQDLLISLRLNR